MAYADVSTGEFLTTQAQELEQLTQELMRLQPSEVLVPTNAPDLVSLLRPGEKSDHLPDCLPPQFCYTLRSQAPFVLSEARYRLLQRFRVRSLEGMGCEHLPLAVRAAGGLLEYVETSTEKGTGKDKGERIKAKKQEVTEQDDNKDSPPSLLSPLSSILLPSKPFPYSPSAPTRSLSIW